MSNLLFYPHDISTKRIPISQMENCGSGAKLSAQGHCQPVDHQGIHTQVCLWTSCPARSCPSAQSSVKLRLQVKRPQVNYAGRVYSGDGTPFPASLVTGVRGDRGTVPAGSSDACDKRVRSRAAGLHARAAGAGAGATPRVAVWVSWAGEGPEEGAALTEKAPGGGRGKGRAT